ncbi:MAG: hypothetical protein LBD93_05355 [Treponema sp.]|jgi:hypothetical protein|nr:hypothetical protein [Treponema sp.]
MRLLLLFALCFAAANLLAEEWYLISETELRSIEQYKATSKTNKQIWLSQVQQLKGRAESLQQESEHLNQQLLQERETMRKLTLSFEQLETARLTQFASQQEAIAELKQAVADKSVEAETYKGKAALRLVSIISLLGALAGYIVFRVLRIIPV